MAPLSRLFSSRHGADGPRLGGLLAVLFWCACGITALPLAGIFSLIFAIGPASAGAAILDSLSGQSLNAQILRLGLIPQLALFIWGGSFVILTIQRSAQTRVISPLLLVGWLVLTAFCQFAIRKALAQDSLTLGDFAALLPGLLAQGVGVAAFWGYMREAERPRRYYSHGAGPRRD